MKKLCVTAEETNLIEEISQALEHNICGDSPLFDINSTLTGLQGGKTKYPSIIAVNFTRKKKSKLGIILFLNYSKKKFQFIHVHIMNRSIFTFHHHIDKIINLLQT